MTFEVGKGYKDDFGRTYHVLAKQPIRGIDVLSLSRRNRIDGELYFLGVVTSWPGNRATVFLDNGKFATIYDRGDEE